MIGRSPIGTMCLALGYFPSSLVIGRGGASQALGVLKASKAWLPSWMGVSERRRRDLSMTGVQRRSEGIEPRMDKPEYKADQPQSHRSNTGSNRNPDTPVGAIH